MMTGKGFGMKWCDIFQVKVPPPSSGTRREGARSEKKYGTYQHKICRATCYTIPSIVGGISQTVLNLIQCVKVLRYLFKIC
jgi:hypothetical protein